MSRRLMAWMGLLLSGLQLLGLSTGTQASEPNPTTYTLNTVIELALEHNPTIAGAQGLVRQSRGQQFAAGAYPNPSISGSAGRGAIRDPSTGVKITERTVTVEQPLEWQGKRRARQQAAWPLRSQACAKFRRPAAGSVSPLSPAFGFRSWKSTYCVS